MVSELPPHLIPSKTPLNDYSMGWPVTLSLQSTEQFCGLFPGTTSTTARVSITNWIISYHY